MDRRPAAGRVPLWIASSAGLVHAAFSAYWALGGQWLLATVGTWAVQMAAEDPLRTGLGLGLIAVVKAIAAAVPVLNDSGRLPRPGLWRALSWVGGALLLGYGLLNVVVSGAVLAGLLASPGGCDREALMGHVLLWDPLFALWGGGLLTFLWLTRERRGRRARLAGDRDGRSDA
ncbi:DUF3995 domain-containing protein [Ruania suaedae]|uniref:DUF3995 domain-containing protein n=1 Tax=Ruania suaedae TaxID=2897774 RepID=UPI001E2C7A50|nr:DUF3995 domain-containing protein [Ruania suaedae]UFU03134.1 DUF3995 domain-containing protein [Ruania suaedae]